MSMPRRGSGAAVFRGRMLAPLACLLLAGCASAQYAGTAQLRTAAPPDWLNRTYSVTCDDIVPTGIPATVADGRVRVAAAAALGAALASATLPGRGSAPSRGTEPDPS